jgi:hypothetical protein
MRAKVVLETITQYQGNAESLKFRAVAKSSGYPENGTDEDNTYAKFSPSATFDITITNPALHGQFKCGEKYYVDFTSAN